MRTKLFLRCGLLVCASLLFFMTSCVDDRYDLSKGVDATIAFGKGVSVPIGSTAKIMLSEIVDTASTDVLEIDSLTGDYSITVAGTFEPQAFNVGGMNIAITALPERKRYDFELINLSQVANLPQWVIEEMEKQKYPFVVRNEVDYAVNFDVTPNVPREIKKIRSLTFENEVKLAVNLKIYSESHDSDDLLEIVDRISLKSASEDGLMLNVPEYLVFTDGETGNNGCIVLNGSAKYDTATKSLTYAKEMYIKALDFSYLPGGYLPVNDGVIDLHNELHAIGYVESDTVLLGYENITHIQSVDVECNLAIDRFVIKEVEGVFDYNLEAIDEVVELSLDDELEFLKDAYFDFNDPRVYLTVNNPLDATIFASARFAALDGDGNRLNDADVAVDVELLGNAENRLFINRYENSVEGYRTVSVPGLNELLKQLPDKVEIGLDARADTTSFVKLELDTDYMLDGEYRVSLPMNFDEFRIAYTTSFEDVLGDTDDYTNGLSALKLSFDVLNTIPLELVPEVVAYDVNGEVIDLLSIELDGAIKKGNGVAGGEVTEPVVSPVVMTLSASRDELDSLDRIDLRMTGTGSGLFNAKEYLQLKNIVLTINEAIVVDLDANDN